MNQRERFVLRAALIYAQSNLDDLNQAFAEDDANLSVNGDLGRILNEEEVERLIMVFQD